MSQWLRDACCTPCMSRPGAAIALRLRSGVAQELGFTCSAGIGPNKLLAKIGSAKNKPNKQTVVLPRAVEGLMQVRSTAEHMWCTSTCFCILPKLGRVGCPASGIT